MALPLAGAAIQKRAVTWSLDADRERLPTEDWIADAEMAIAFYKPAGSVKVNLEADLFTVEAEARSAAEPSGETPSELPAGLR